MLQLPANAALLVVDVQRIFLLLQNRQSVT